MIIKILSSIDCLKYAHAPRYCCKIPTFFAEHDMLETNPLTYQIDDLRERVESLRGYL
jgi:hypothetical protein